MEPTVEELERLAADHLWMHFTPLADDTAPHIISRGEGCYVWDSRGKRYLDGLSGLFVVQVGHGRSEMAAAAGKQAGDLGYFPIWTYAHPTAIKLAARLAGLAPGDINRVFFTTGGSEAVETAWKLARQYHRSQGEPGRFKVIARDLAYHGTTLGALAITGLASIRAPYEPVTPGGHHCVNTNQYRCQLCAHVGSCTLACADDIERAILREDPSTVAAVFLEPVQNAGGCFTPPEGYFQRVREICDKYGILLVSDEVICAFGRLGYMFGCERYGYQPDIITVAKGLTSGYAPLGATLISDRVAEPFEGGRETFLHGLTFAGHPVSCAVALENLDVFEREGVLENVRSNESGFRDALLDLGDIPIVGDVRGAGYFWGIELVKDQGTRETFEGEEEEEMLRGFLSPRLFELGLICRADDRGDPVVQLAPPLVSGPEQIEEINGILRKALSETWERFVA
ncbi:MAG: aspartate aminotransferase family protein [Acidimicrobiia bacterium]|nr:aspartate aminotransferase family protein [Acidimicrobiia bacterium]